MAFSSVLLLSFLVLPFLRHQACSAEPSWRTLPRTRPERRIVGGVSWRRQDYRDYFTKGMRKPAFITRRVELAGPELKHAEKLLRSSIVRKIFLESSRPSDCVFSIERLSGCVQLTGPAEIVAGLQTMIQDNMTFLFATRERPSDKTLAVLTVVDPDFLRTEPDVAAGIAEDNYEGIKRILNWQDNDYRRSGKRAWLNRPLGTVTILDRRENVEKVREYLAIRPYAPRRRTY